MNPEDLQKLVTLRMPFGKHQGTVFAEVAQGQTFGEAAGLQGGLRSATVRANGAVMAPLLILIFSAVIVRFSIGFGLYDYVGADAIWSAFIATSIASCVLSIAYYLNGSWKKAKAMPMMGAPPLQAAPE